MKKNKPNPKGLVPKETLERFLRLTTAQRLHWLDEAREFNWAAVPERTKRMAERLRKEKGL